MQGVDMRHDTGSRGQGPGDVRRTSGGGSRSGAPDGGAFAASVSAGLDVKAHVLATEDRSELRIVLIKRDEKERVVVDVMVQGA